MISVVFPDGREQQYEKGVAVLDVVNSISTTLTKKTVCALVNGKVVDLQSKLEDDCTIKFLTLDTKDANEKKEILHVMRHSCAHLFAQAMRELYGNKVRFAFGPATETGFYYDFELDDDVKITTEDFPKIEKKMHELAEKKFEIVRKETTKEEAMEFFGKQGEKYKVELLEEKLDSDVLKVGKYLLKFLEKFIQHHKNVINSFSPNDPEIISPDGDLIPASKSYSFLASEILGNRNELKKIIEDIKITKFDVIKECFNQDYKQDYQKYDILFKKLDTFCLSKNLPELTLILNDYNINTRNPQYEAVINDYKEDIQKAVGYLGFKQEKNIAKKYALLHDFLDVCYYKEEYEKFISDQHITTYTQGNFTDLCRGPHVMNTGFLKHFKLMKVSGAYWRADAKNAMLQRVYGTCWSTKEELDNYLKMLEEAEKRDHRKLGQQLDLFHLQEEAPGCAFWHPRGWTLYLLLQNYIREKIKKHGYIEVKTPQIVSKTLWEKSGHWTKYREHMFITRIDEEDMDFAIKPMNCPCHVEIFKNKIRSYKDLPIRMAEFGKCHRYEPSGSLHGLMRVRGFVQDDAHIFCTEEQIAGETIAFYKLLKEVYSDFGFDNIKVKFSDRPEMRVGSDELWDKAEKALREPMEQAGVELELNKGDGAFYGPKLEFVLKDAIGREWQCGTFQVDFNLGQRLGAEYVDEDGTKKPPVMLHRAVLGSFERFIAILIEHFAGAFPLWLAPVQAVVIGVNNELDGEVLKIVKKLQDAGIRCEADLSKETVSYKVRRQSEMKIPYIITIGHREVENNTLSVRKFGEMKNETIGFDEFVEIINKQVLEKK